MGLDSLRREIRMLRDLRGQRSDMQNLYRNGLAELQKTGNPPEGMARSKVLIVAETLYVMEADLDDGFPKP